MLWVDKYRPKTLEDIELLPEITKTLKRLGASEAIPHLLVYGPSGAGKRTRVMALLQEQFGPSVFNVKLEHKTVRVNDTKTIEVTALSSPFHIDINPSDAGSNDRVIVMQMIKEIAQSAPVVSNKTMMTKDITTTISCIGQTPKSGAKDFKVIIINEADQLTRAAQQALRRTMEKYTTVCRMVLITNTCSRIIPALRSRCLGIRVPLHTAEDVALVTKGIIKKEIIAGKVWGGGAGQSGEEGAMVSDAFCRSLHARSEGNLRRAMLMLEACKMNQIDLKGNGEAIPLPDWKHYVSEIAYNLVNEQSPKMLFEIRGKCYELLAQCIPGEHIMKEVLLTLLVIAPPAARSEIAAAAAIFDVNLKQGMRPIMHLEAFFAHAMRAIKRFKN